MRKATPRPAPLADDDQQLATMARAGDRTAFDRLVHRYLERTFLVALRMVGNREDAEDLTQETFARAQEKLGQFRGHSTFGTWVTSICVRLCLDHERSRERRNRWLPRHPEPDLSPPPTPAHEDPSCKLQYHETARTVNARIQELPRRLRTALVLRVLQGLPYDEVAAVLGTTLRSARIYVSEARRILADQLSQAPEKNP